MNNRLENVLPSLIILKNSIVSGAIPVPEDLDVGEVALSLFKDEESIWVKNSSNEIVNLRKPRYDLFWGDLFRSYETLDEFNTDLVNGNINENSIVYIKKERLIWTGGVTYASSYNEEEIVNILKSRFIFLSEEVFLLGNESSSDEILDSFGSIEEFNLLISKVENSEYFSSIKLPESGNIPVSLTSYDKNTLVIGYINFDVITKKEISLSNSNEFTIVVTELNLIEELNAKASKDVATISENGLMSSEDKQNLDSILKGNIKVVTPTITGTWKFFNYRGDTSLIISPAPDTFNPIIEKGYKAQFTGTYIWNHEEGRKDPTSTGPDSNWVSLPGPGVQSSIYTSKKLDKSTTISVSIQAPKTGLMITEDNGIILASGFDYSYDSRTVSILDRAYFGKSTKGIRTINEGDIKELPSELIDYLEFKVSDVTCEENEYFVFAYPKEMGDLNNITQNYVQPILDSFSMKSLNIINEAGLGILLNVYVSNNPGAFYDSVLNFY